MRQQGVTHVHADHHDHGDHHGDGQYRPPTFDVFAEMNGVWEGKNSVSDVVDDHSDGNLIYFSPGVRWTTNERWPLFFSADIPSVQNVNGANHETDYRLIGGTSVVW